MKNILIAIIAIILATATAAITNSTTDETITAMVRDYNNSEYAVPVDEFDLDSIEEDSSMYIEKTSKSEVNTIDLSYFAWRKDGELLLSHSGLDWWLEQHGIVTQNHGGDDYQTCLVDEGMYFIDIEEKVEYCIPFAPGYNDAVTASSVIETLKLAGIEY